MRYELWHTFGAERKRLIWIAGLLFTTVILFQYIELPDASALWSVFSTDTTRLQRTSDDRDENATFNSSISSNGTSQTVSNSSRVYVDSNGVSKNDSSLEENVGQNNSFKFENSSVSDSQKDDLSFGTIQKGNVSSGFESPPVVSQPVMSTLNGSSSSSSNKSVAAPFMSELLNVSTKDTSSPRLPPSMRENPVDRPKTPTKAVYAISDMNELLSQSHASPSAMVPRWSSKVDKDLMYVRSEIEKGALMEGDGGLYAPIYRNVSLFRRSYELMEQILKVYIYKGGDRRIFHRPPLEGIYASEGWFMKLLEANKHFVTKRPGDAHLFYLPFSSRALEETLYVPNSHTFKNLIRYLSSYVDTISGKYPFWNRTDGADHFLVACHDWAAAETKRRMANCIRALCNADVKEGFHFGKDVSLPETYVRKPRNPLRDVGGKPPSKRRILAFYAGNMHGYVRPILLRHWGNDTTTDMKIFGRLPHSKGNRNYIDYMKSSKFCICPKGYEVNSPRVVEAIFFECVPVIISDNFVPPFFETLNWESFSVFVMEKDIPELKNILLSIPQKKYLRMQMRVKKVQQHFLWHPKPVKYDLFHMILHSVWYNRVFQFRPK